jgi:xanthine dehydrogenase small subunit
MTEAHATQCGFCTPGFVMSLVAERHGENRRDTSQINDVLAGNLCRCTGYGTIIQAAKDAAADPVQDQIKAGQTKTIELLSSLQDEPMLSLQSEERAYFAPTTTKELADLLHDNPDAIMVAGATDVGLWVTKQHRILQTVIYIGNIKDLQKISISETNIKIGAGVTYSEAWPVLTGFDTDLGELVRRIASTQIRNSGTIGGNIANGSPIGDMPPALIALNAQITLTSNEHSRLMPLEDFFVSYGKQNRNADEFVHNILIPARKENHLFKTYKISKRFDQDISALCGAFHLELSGDTVADIRICYGGMAGTPQRAHETEQALIGKNWTLETVKQAMQIMTQDYSPLTDMRASDTYRMLCAQNLLQKFYIETTEPAALTRLVGEGSRSHA